MWSEKADWSICSNSDRSIFVTELDEGSKTVLNPERVNLNRKVPLLGRNE